jgi:bifunctional UDP-N-acetylglucosamine pyrophosphorylase/glucosamine-1-phosphate N-acetyltransferase
MNDKITFLILAAGKGTRMKNSLPKVMHKVAGKTLIENVIDTAKTFPNSDIISILSPSMPQIAAIVSKKYNSEIIYQTQQLGTGHAVKICLEKLKGKTGVVVALYGDTPFVSEQTILKLIEKIDDKTTISVLGFEVEKENAYGRLICDNAGNLLEIVEVKEASEAQKKVKLCNSGVIAFSAKHIENIVNKIENNNSKKEYYLTDAVKIANQLGFKCGYVTTEENEVLGINSQQELVMAENIMQEKLREKHLLNGVIISAPETVYFSAETEIAAGVEIEPFVVFKGVVKIEEGAVIKSFSHLENCFVGKNANIGPYARIRPETNIGEDVKIGNFVEIKKSNIGKNSKISHLSYIGDTEMAEDVNIGAGTITCNYDGFNKFKTTIEQGAFVGSNSSLVAPVKVGKNAVIGAGTTLLKDAESDKITINSLDQKTKDKK